MNHLFAAKPRHVRKNLAVTVTSLSQATCHFCLHLRIKVRGDHFAPKERVSADAKYLVDMLKIPLQLLFARALFRPVQVL